MRDDSVPTFQNVSNTIAVVLILYRHIAAMLWETHKIHEQILSRMQSFSLYVLRYIYLLRSFKIFLLHRIFLDTTL